MLSYEVQESAVLIADLCLWDSLNLLAGLIMDLGF
jgi:hypothetical protein